MSDGRTEVRMPNLGYDMEAGKVVAWLKRVGDEVARGEPLVEIETDKTTIQVEALASGTLAEILAEEGAEVPVGDVVAYLE